MAESSPRPVVSHSSPRRPLTLDDKFARIANKVTGAESDHRIAFGESHRISHQNQLRRSCIESPTVPVYTSFSRDSPAYNLTVNFEKLSGRRHDDPRFRMYKAMIKHPDAFELPEREIHLRKLLGEIEVLATKQNVEINFDDGVPKISPRQTKMVVSPRGSPAREENRGGKGSAAQHSPKKIRNKKALVSGSGDPTSQNGEESQQDGEQMNSRRENEKEAFAVPTFIASEFRKSTQEGDEGEAEFQSSSSLASASASDAVEKEKESKKLITFRNPKISTPTDKERLSSKKSKTCSYHAAGGDDKKAVADRMPEIITPRVVHPRARIEEMLRARETIIGEVMGATNNNGNSNNNQSATNATINNNQSTTQRFVAPPFSVAALTSTTSLSSPPSTSAILLASPQPTNNNNNMANPSTPSMSLSQGFGFDSSISKSTFSTSNPYPTPAAARSAVIPQPPPANSARRQSLAIPVILGGGPEVLTDAAKLVAKRQQRDSLRKERGEGAGHGHKNRKKNGGGSSLSPKTLRTSGKHNNNNGSSPRRKRSTLLEEDSVDSHSSERFEDIPLFDDQNDARSSSCGRSVGDNDSNSSSESGDSSGSEYSSSDDESLESGATAVGGGDAQIPPLHLLKRCKPPKKKNGKKKSKSARNGEKGRNANNADKALLLTSQPMLDGSPVAVVRSFHLKAATKPQAPKPPMEASGRGRGNGAKNQQRGGHPLELLDETTMGRPDTLDNKNGGEANSGLSRAGSGITLAIPSSPRHYANKDFAASAPLAPMPAPQRGVVGASMLTVRDQIIRSIGGVGGAGGQSDGKLGSSSSINAAEIASASITLASPGASSRQIMMGHGASFNMGGKSGGGAVTSATTTTATISSNWCLSQPKQEVSRESTQTAVVSALSTPRAVRDLFISSAQIGGGGATVGGSTAVTPGGIGGAASARASFYQNGTLSFANMKRQQQSFAGFGPSTSRKASTMLGFNSTYNTMLSSNFGSTYGGMGGGGGSDRGSNYNYDGSSSEFVDRERGAESALIHVIPPVVFRGLTSSGAGTIQPRRKRAMAVTYGSSSKVTDLTQKAEEEMSAAALITSENTNYDQRAPKVDPPPPAQQPDLMQTIAGTKTVKNPSCGRGRPADGSLSSRI